MYQLEGRINNQILRAKELTPTASWLCIKNLTYPYPEVFYHYLFFTYETRAYGGGNIPVVLVIIAHAEPVITSRQGAVVGF